MSSTDVVSWWSFSIDFLVLLWQMFGCFSTDESQMQMKLLTTICSSKNRFLFVKTLWVSLSVFFSSVCPECKITETYLSHHSMLSFLPFLCKNGFNKDRTSFRVSFMSFSHTWNTCLSSLPTQIIYLTCPLNYLSSFPRKFNWINFSTVSADTIPDLLYWALSLWVWGFLPQ